MDHDPHPNVFDAMVRFLESLRISDTAKNTASDHDEKQMAAALLRLQWTVLVDCGFKPELDRDVVTGEPLEAAQLATSMSPGSSAAKGPLMFDPRAGGVTMEMSAMHSGQSVSDAGPWRVRSETIDLLRRLAFDSASDLSDVDSDRLRRANRLLCVFIRSIIDRELPTMKFVLE